MKRQSMVMLRAQHGLTQAQTAEKLKICLSTYNLIENGKRNGTRDFWLRYQELFKLEDGEVWKIQNGFYAECAITQQKGSK